MPAFPVNRAIAGQGLNLSANEFRTFADHALAVQVQGEQPTLYRVINSDFVDLRQYTHSVQRSCICEKFLYENHCTCVNMDDFEISHYAILWIFNNTLAIWIQIRR
ncbi:hypothetical protein QLX08_006160 [Tetragonisca angustula]|uniref:Uncharacterized protein n=1 Tax=Tetragonisca angustula TaxID=166442 RepID=A0AAW0ZX85_9HYME